jgi:polysaccharide deacetylase 2 family uncharacterized protein YibQ
LRGFPRREKGDVRSSLITAAVVFLVLAVTAILMWRYLEGPSKSTGQGPIPTVIPSSTAFKGDPAEATEKLLKALNQKLQDLDLLKLLAKEVEIKPVTVSGTVFPTYREEFRLPLRYSPDQLFEKLIETAKLSGVQSLFKDKEIGNNGYREDSFSYAFNSEWTPVVLVFIQDIKPKVCLIIDDGGYQKGEALDHLYGCKIPITVAIIPDAEFSKNLAEELPGHGVEVMCHMPMEGHEKGAVGGNYKELLRKGMGDSKAKALVEKALAGLPNCRGLNNHMGSEATVDPELMWDVCQVLKPRGLFIIDSRTTAQSVVEPVAKKAQVPVAHRDVFLDNVETPEAILKQLNQLVARARKKGLAVGIGHFKTPTLKTLAEAVQKLKEQGIQFVYASEVVREE